MKLLLLLLALAAAPPAAAQDTTVVRHQLLEEVLVLSSSADQRISEPQLGTEQLSLKQLALAPSLFGEHDVMRHIQLLPGVKAESDASSSFQVRGGTSAQNSILLDHAPVYNVGHLGGLFSAFNHDALASATLMKGLIPAQYGDATAAVLDLVSRTASRDHCHASATVGLLSARASLETPFDHGRGGLLLAARRSYIDLFVRQVPDFRHNTMYFYDLNAKADYRLSPTDQLLLSLFHGRDRMAVKSVVDIGWQNIDASLTWIHHFTSPSSSKSVTLHSSLLTSSYSTDNGFSLLSMDLSFTGHIRQSGFRQVLHLTAPRRQLNLGLQSALLHVKSAEWQQVDSHEREQRRAWQSAAWFSGVWQLPHSLTLSAGLRLSHFSALGGSLYYDVDTQGDIIRLYNPKPAQLFKTYLSLEPRLSLNCRVSPQLSLKAAYTRSSQNIHALRNQSTSTPFDRYTVSSNLVRPQVAHQLSAGLFTMTTQGHYDLSLEAYYRHADHVLDYRDGKSFSSEIQIERLVLPGQGRSYGAELAIRKSHGHLTGWAAYTLAWSLTRIPGINGGRWYTAGNDRRHDVDIVAIYSPRPAWQLSLAWVYNSGQAFTAPSGKYAIEDNYIYYYAERNGYRAPAYHRLDASATYTRQLRRTTQQWDFGIYNLYNRYNPFVITFEDSQNGARTRAVQYSLFGILPSVSFTVKF